MATVLLVVILVLMMVPVRYGLLMAEVVVPGEKESQALAVVAAAQGQEQQVLAQQTIMVLVVATQPSRVPTKVYLLVAVGQKVLIAVTLEAMLVTTLNMEAVAAVVVLSMPGLEELVVLPYMVQGAVVEVLGKVLGGLPLVAQVEPGLLILSVEEEQAGYRVAVTR